MDLSMNFIVTFVMHAMNMVYSFLEKFMGVSFDDLTTTGETEPEG